jgi:hypothetical protein
VAVAYKISEEAFAEYRERVVERMGEKKEEAVRAEIAQEHLNRNPVSQAQVIVIGAGRELCLEKFTGRYFMSSVQDLRKAQNDTNEQLLHDGHVSLGDFYERVGLPGTSISDEVGWNAENRQLELKFTSAISDDDRPCIVIDFNVEPIRSFYRCN